MDKFDDDSHENTTVYDKNKTKRVLNQNIPSF